MPDPRSNLASFLRDLARDPARPAFGLRTPYRRFIWTAGETTSAAFSVARRLERAGIAPGDRVMLSGPNGPAWVAAFLGIVARGAVVVPLDETAPCDLRRAISRKVSARAALAPREAAETFGETTPTIATFEETDDLRLREDVLYDVHEASRDDTAQIVFTSGTTAEPKGVVLTHANLLSAVERIEKGFLKRERYLAPFLPFRFLCLVPLSHMFGQTLGIAIPIVMRSTALFSSTLRSARIVETIRRDRPIAVITVPRTLASLRDAVFRELDRRGTLEAFERALARARGKPAWRRIVTTRAIRSVLSWRTWALVVGGASLDVRVESFWSDCGFAVIQGYGMTEAAPIVTVHNPLDGVVGTVGRAVHGQEIRLAEDGEILVRGPNVMKGYFDDPEETGRAIEDGWLRTGDLGERDETGRIFIRGRKKDLIVTASGMNVYPADVERALDAVPGVREAVAFALPGADGDEVGAAVLVDTPGLSPGSIRSRANEALQSHQHLREVFVWEEDDFPRTTTGKVKRRDIVAALASRPDIEETPEPGPGADAPRVRSALRSLRPDAVSRLAPGAVLGRDLGLGSLEVVELLSVLEEEHDVAIDDDRVRGPITVEDLDRLVRERRGDSISLPMPRWTRRLPARVVRRVVLRVLARPAFAIFVRFEVVGRATLADAPGPLLVVANHTSMLDAPAVLFGLPAHLRTRLAPAMAIETLPAHFEPEGKRFVERMRSSLLYHLAVLVFGAYPLPQSRGFRPSLEYTGALLDAGWSPLVFPEGKMSRTGQMLPFKAGIGLLALETKARVLPVHLSGLGAILPPGSRWPGRGNARLRIGEVIDPLEGGVTDPAAIASRIERAVRSLAD